MRKNKLLAFLLLGVATFICGCGNSDKNTDNREEHRSTGRQLWKYVYIDKLNCVHTNRYCEELFLGEIRNDGVKITNNAVHFIPIESFCSGANDYYFCCMCVTDELFEKIHIYDKVNEMYNIIHEYEFVSDNRHTFVRNMIDSRQYRIDLLDKLNSEGITVFKNVDELEQKLGMDTSAIAADVEAAKKSERLNKRLRNITKKE